MEIVKIYTDGACRGNPGPGGWGVLLRYGTTERTIQGAEQHTTNNRMELTAAIQGIAGLTRPCRVDLYTDSQYLRQGMTQWINTWKKKNWRNSKGEAVKNVDLWQRLDALVAGHQVHWHWVKAHAGHPENERADALANAAIDAMTMEA